MGEINYYDYGAEASVGYMRWHLTSLQKRGVEIDALLDIGACHGHFATLFTEIYPQAHVTAIECNDLNAPYFEGKDWDVQFTCLGETDATKAFYIDQRDPIGSGSSFYKEQRYQEPTTKEKRIVTLDSLRLPPHDLIKIDTQGSELDILRGGEKTISAARVLLIEASFVPYNDNGVLIDDLLAETRRMGFRMIDTFGPRYGGHVYKHQKTQVDVLLVRDGDGLLAFAE